MALARPASELRGDHVRRSDLAGGWLQARTRISFRSYGENVYVDNGGHVHISSECWWPLAVIDWGKNRWNVKRIAAHLASLLGVPF